MTMGNRMANIILQVDTQEDWVVITCIKMSSSKNSQEPSSLHVQNGLRIYSIMCRENTQFVDYELWLTVYIAK